MYRKDSACPGAYRAHDGPGSHVGSIGVNVDRHRPQTGICHGEHRSYVCIGRHEHLIAGLQSPKQYQCTEYHAQRIQAVAHTYCMACTGHVGKHSLESFHFGAADIAARQSHPVECRAYIGHKRPVHLL